MIEKDLRKINVEVSNECWKKLKILSVQKEISLSQCVKDVLERSVQSKKYDIEVTE